MLPDSFAVSISPWQMGFIEDVETILKAEEDRKVGTN